MKLSRRMTKRDIDAMVYRGEQRTYPSGKVGWTQDFRWCPDLDGFGVQVFPTGRVSFVIRFARGRRDGRRVLGQYGRDLTLEQARRKAREVFAEVAKGASPPASRRLPGTSERMTVAAVVERYLAWAGSSKRPRRPKRSSTIRNERLFLCAHVVPTIGNLDIRRVEAGDIEKVRGLLADRPTSWAQVRALLSSSFKYAANEEKLDVGNLALEVPLLPLPEDRDRSLSRDEIRRLGKALRDLEDRFPRPVAAVRLLLLTGLRKREVLDLRWSDVDAERGLIRIRASKTGARDAPLTEPAAELLAGIPRDAGSEFVFPGRDGRPLQRIERAWREIRAEAGLPDLRIHDLRHVHGSRAGDANLSPFVVAGMLGHRQVSTTERYVRVRDEVRRGTELVAGDLARALEGASEESEDEPGDPKPELDVLQRLVAELPPERKAEALRRIADLLIDPA